MLVGFSVSKCIIDIIEGNVDTKDILVIIGRTDFDIEHIDSLIDQYRHYNGVWMNYDTQTLRNLLIDLYKSGKIHQPRKFGQYPRSVVHGKHWGEVLTTPRDLTPAAKKAWENYKLLAAFEKRSFEIDDNF